MIPHPLVGTEARSTTSSASLARTLFILTITVFTGVIVELLAAKHYGEPLQLIPFGLTALCLASTLAGWRWPSRPMMRWLQVLMVLTAIGSALGMYFHIRSNVEFVTDFQPDASWQTIAREAFTGRNPILAPGILLLGAILGYLAASGHAIDQHAT